MLVELHMIQNFAPANLNRDDTGAPKDAEFGGYRRARISSQCIKRAIRATLRDQQLMDAHDLGTRTKRLKQELVDRLVARKREASSAAVVVEFALSAVGFTTGDDGKTQYLLFLGEREIEQFAQLCDKSWEILVGVTGRAGDDKTAKKAKKAAKEAVPAHLQAELVKALDGGKARDVALFGRMLADLPGARVDAACQVAHAISTNRVNMEFDYYTAVDDLKPEDTQGADMIGDVQFNSACFYRYLNVDIEQLAVNLGDDRAAAIETVRAFIEAAIEAIPTGKQNSMAAQNPPSLVLAVVRRHGAWSLANAFVEPVRPTANENLIVGSIRKLDEYWARLSGMYGAGTLLGAFVCTTEPETLCALSQDVQPGVVKVESVDELKCAVTETLKRN